MAFKLYFVLFLFLCLFCQLCGQACAAQGAQVQGDAKENTFSDFLKPENKKITKLLGTDGKENKSANFIVKTVESVFLAAADGVMIAMAEVTNNDGDDEKTNLLAKFIETSESHWGEKAIKPDENNNNWKVQLAAEKLDKPKSTSAIKRFVVSAEKEKTIYYFTFSNDIFEGGKLPDSSTPAYWNGTLVVGNVKNNGGTGKTITWRKLNFFSKFYEGGQSKKLSELQPENIQSSDSFVFVTSKKIYFVLVMKPKEAASSGGKKYIIAVLGLEKSGEGKLELLSVDNVENCYPSFFQLEEEIFMTPTTCSNGVNHNVKALDETENILEKSNKPIARLRDFFNDKKHFVSASIQSKNVLLFTQQKSEDGKNDAHLWMTDGTRVGYVGTIVEGIVDNDKTFYGSILHTNDELFALHQKYQIGGSGEKDANKFSLTRLKNQLDKIKNFLNEWENNKETVSKLCDNIDKQKIICTKAPPTDGLVGFLHETTTENNWKDKFSYADATIHGDSETKNVKNGFAFSGKNAGAKWSMKNKQNEKPYNFINFGFALVATVEIGSDTNGKRNSILGMKLTSNTNTNNNVGLWCDADGKWGVSGRDTSASKLSGKECKQGNTYNVALVLNGNEKNKNLEIYVNGEKLTTEKITILPSESIEHFYFGADVESDESYVTVTNVLLYNRPFNDGEEIGNLKNYVKSVEVVTPQGDQQTPPTLPQGSTGEEKKDEKGPSQSRAEDGGVGGGVRVFSLLLALLCAALPPLLHP